MPSIAVPRGQQGLLSRLTAGPLVPGLAARAGARLAASAKPWRIGTTVIAAAHDHVREALSRDLDFRVAPVNAGRIADVTGSFVLGMDRDPVLARERDALYTALAAVDMAPIAAAARVAVEARIGAGPVIDAVDGYARPIAAQTAQLLFGVTGPDDATFQDVARAIFCHTFLNLSNDEVVRARAIAAAGLLNGWLADAIARRRRDGVAGADMMGALIRAGALDDDGIGHTLAGMLVGSIDTTASAVARIVATAGRDRALLAAMGRDADDPARLRGWCWEALRRWPHNPILLRRAIRDTVLAGTAVRAGDRVVLWTQAAMLDASAFPDPARLRPDRPPAHYLHFGGALHCCAGRSVNGWQIPLLVGALIRRGVASVGRVDWAGPFPDRLPVTFSR